MMKRTILQHLAIITMMFMFALTPFDISYSEEGYSKEQFKEDCTMGGGTYTESGQSEFGCVWVNDNGKETGRVACFEGTVCFSSTGDSWDMAKVGKGLKTELKALRAALKNTTTPGRSKTEVKSNAKTSVLNDEALDDALGAGPMIPKAAPKIVAPPIKNNKGPKGQLPEVTKVKPVGDKAGGKTPAVVEVTPKATAPVTKKVRLKVKPAPVGRKLPVVPEAKTPIITTPLAKEAPPHLSSPK